MSKNDVVFYLTETNHKNDWRPGVFFTADTLEAAKRKAEDAQFFQATVLSLYLPGHKGPQQTLLCQYIDGAWQDTCCDGYDDDFIEE